MTLVALKPTNFVGLILWRPGTAGVRKSSGHQQSALKGKVVVVGSVLPSSTGGRFRLLRIAITQPGDLFLFQYVAEPRKA